MGGYSYVYEINTFLMPLELKKLFLKFLNDTNILDISFFRKRSDDITNPDYSDQENNIIRIIDNNKNSDIYYIWMLIEYHAYSYYENLDKYIKKYKLKIYENNNIYPLQIMKKGYGERLGNHSPLSAYFYYESDEEHDDEISPWTLFTSYCTNEYELE
jgi:hypothetical protein